MGRIAGFLLLAQPPETRGGIGNVGFDEIAKQLIRRIDPGRFRLDETHRQGRGRKNHIGFHIAQRGFDAPRQCPQHCRLAHRVIIAAAKPVGRAQRQKPTFARQRHGKEINDIKTLLQLPPHRIGIA